jgi:hypothetical protein
MTADQEWMVWMELQVPLVKWDPQVMRVKMVKQVLKDHRVKMLKNL